MIFAFLATLGPYHLEVGCRTSVQVCSIMYNTLVSTVTKWFASVSTTLEVTGSQKVEKNLWTLNFSRHDEQDFKAWTEERFHFSHHYWGNLFVDEIQGAATNYTPRFHTYSQLVRGHVVRQLNKKNGQNRHKHADAERNWNLASEFRISHRKGPTEQ